MFSSSMHAYTHVVIGIIRNDNHEVVVTRRKENTHLQGLLEFPGGKIEDKELPVEALKRELQEELSINVIKAEPLIQIPYHYADRNVLLNVFCVNEYTGKVIANEEQKLFWKSINSLNDKKFPAANYGIIRALQLPRIFPVTSDFSNGKNNLIAFEKIVSREDVEIIQLRSHDLPDKGYIELAEQCVDLCKQHEVKLILNRELDCNVDIDISGIHMTSEKLLKLKNRPLGSDYLVGASCHNAVEIEKANQLGLDYIFVGPVLEKVRNANAKILKWDGFSRLASMSLTPVYAIGGLTLDAQMTCLENGGQGIAAIRIFS